MNRAILIILTLICFSCSKKPEYFLGDYKSLLTCKVTTDTIHRAYVVNLKQGPIILLYPDLKAQFKNLNLFELYQLRLNISIDSVSKQIKGDLSFDLDSIVDIVFYDSLGLFQTDVGLFPATNMRLDSFKIDDNKLSFRFHFDNHGGNWHNYSAAIIKDNNNAWIEIDTLFLGQFNSSLNPLFKKQLDNFYQFDTFDNKAGIKKIKKVFYNRQKDILDSILKTKDSLKVLDTRNYFELLDYYYK